MSHPSQLVIIDSSMTTKVQQALRTAREAVDLLVSSLKYRPETSDAYATAFLNVLQGDPLLRAGMVEALQQQERDVRPLVTTWAGLRPRLEKLYDYLCGFLVLKGLAEQRELLDFARPLLVWKDGSGWEGVANGPQLQTSCRWLWHIVERQEVWFTCPTWLAGYLLNNLWNVEAFTTRLAGGVRMDLELDRRAHEDFVQKLDVLVGQLSHRPWASLLDLIAHAKGFLPHESIYALTARARHFRPTHIEYEFHEHGKDDPATVAAPLDADDFARRMVLRAQTVTSWFEAYLPIGPLVRAVLVRYKLRSELYHHKLLHCTFMDDGESVLRTDVAAYLFDQGFYPIAESVEGTYRPDLIDPAAVEPIVMEVKCSEKRSEILQGFLQALRYARRRAYARAYYLIFLIESGAEWDVPPSFEHGGIEIVTIQVDLSGAVARAPGPVTRKVWDEIRAALVKEL